MREKYKKTFKYLNYVEHLLNLASTVTGFVSISEFALLVCVPVGITSSAIGKKKCNHCINQKYKATIKKQKKHGKIMLLGKK